MWEPKRSPKNRWPGAIHSCTVVAESAKVLCLHRGPGVDQEELELVQYHVGQRALASGEHLLRTLQVSSRCLEVFTRPVEGAPLATKSGGLAARQLRRRRPKVSDHLLRSTGVTICATKIVKEAIDFLELHGCDWHTGRRWDRANSEDDM